MIKQIIFSTLLISQSALASHILTKHVTSGNVRPEDSFVKDCRFTNDGHVRVTIKLGLEAPRTHFHHISEMRVTEIKNLVRRAHSGRIVEVGATCDGGDNLLDGFITGHKVILDESFDCGRHLQNQSSSVPRLKSIAMEICGF